MFSIAMLIIGLVIGGLFVTRYFSQASNEVFAEMSQEKMILYWERCKKKVDKC
jgi:hypothetical protein